MRAADTFSAEFWRNEAWRTVTEALTHAKTVSRRSSRCAIMTTNDNDCDEDAVKVSYWKNWKGHRDVRVASRASMFLMLLHGSQELSLGGANALAKNQTCIAYSVAWSLVTKSADDDLEDVQLNVCGIQY